MNPHSQWNLSNPPPTWQEKVFTGAKLVGLSLLTGFGFAAGVSIFAALAILASGR